MTDALSLWERADCVAPDLDTDLSNEKLLIALQAEGALPKTHRIRDQQVQLRFVRFLHLIATHGPIILKRYANLMPVRLVDALANHGYLSATKDASTGQQIVRTTRNLTQLIETTKYKKLEETE